MSIHKQDVPSQQIMDLLRRINELECELAKYKKDAELLDWIESHKETIYSVWDIRKGFTTSSNPEYQESRIFCGWSVASRLDEHKTIREAIAAAMKEEV